MTNESPIQVPLSRLQEVVVVLTLIGGVASTFVPALTETDSGENSSLWELGGAAAIVQWIIIPVVISLLPLLVRGKNYKYASAGSAIALSLLALLLAGLGLIFFLPAAGLSVYAAIRRRHMR